MFNMFINDTSSIVVILLSSILYGIKDLKTFTLIQSNYVTIN
jgi:hypothetical protein